MIICNELKIIYFVKYIRTTVMSHGIVRKESSPPQSLPYLWRASQSKHRGMRDMICIWFWVDKWFQDVTYFACFFWWGLWAMREFPGFYSFIFSWDSEFPSKKVWSGIFSIFLPSWGEAVCFQNLVGFVCFRSCFLSIRG